MDLYFGTRAVLLARGGAPEEAHATDDWSASLQVLTKQIAALPGRATVRVWLSGSLCRPFVMPVLPSLTSESERLRAMMAFAQRACGFDGPVRVQSQEGRQGEPAIGMAMEADRLDSIKAALATLRVRALAPWWMAALNHRLQGAPDTSCIAIQDCDSMTFLAGEGAGFTQASSLTPSPESAAALASYRRLQFSLGPLAGSVAPLYVLDGARANPAHEPSLDGLALAPFVRQES